MTCVALRATGTRIRRGEALTRLMIASPLSIFLRLFPAMKPLFHLGGRKDLDDRPAVRAMAEHRTLLHLRQKIQHFLGRQGATALDGRATTPSDVLKTI